MSPEKDQKVAFFIDDDADFVEMIPQIVSHPGFEIKAYRATNGYQAIDQVIKTRPQVLFIDFAIPRANGSQILSVLKQVRALSELKIYLVTGYALKEVLPFVRDSGFHGVLHKGSNLRSDITKILDDLSHPLAA